MARKTLSDKMRDGALWAYIHVAGVTGLQFLSGIILARILDPSDFGIFIAATAYTAILSTQVIFGLPSALVQAKEISEQQLHGAFWFMEAIALLSTLVVIALSPLLAGSYEDPRYVNVLQLMCITFFFLPYVSITNTLLRREMNFKAISQIRIAATLLNFPVSIVFALLGYGPYSLVIGGVAGIVVTTILLARRRPWIPRLQLHATPLKPLLGYAWRTNVNSTLDTLGERVDNMMVGAMISPHALGIYNRSYSLSRLPVEQLGLSLQPLLFGGLSRIQDNLDYTRAMYQKALGTLALGIFPFILLFIFVAHSFIANIYGEKWLEAALPLQIMAVGAFAFLISITLRALIAAQNLVGKEMPLQIGRVLITIVIVAVAVPGGLAAIAIGITVREFLFAILLKRLVSNAGIGVTSRMIFYAMAPTLWACAIGTGAGFVINSRVLSTTPVTSAIYLLTMSASVLGGYALSVLVMGRLWRTHAPLQSAMAMVANWTNKLPVGGRIARLIHSPIEESK